jgi:hypothetical protein
MMDRVFFVYVDHTLDENRPFYVGKGTAERVRRRGRWKVWKAFVNKHGWAPSCREVIFATRDEQAAFQFEKEMIAHLGTFSLWGANMTEGGEGSSGYRWSDEAKKRASGSNHRMSGQSMTEIERAKRAGENHGGARLTWAIVDEIRRRHTEEGLSTRQLGRLYGVTGQHIQKICTFKKWKPELRPQQSREKVCFLPQIPHEGL